MAEIITFPGLTSLDIEPDEILEQAKGKLLLFVELMQMAINTSAHL